MILINFFNFCVNVVFTILVGLIALPITVALVVDVLLIPLRLFSFIAGKLYNFLRSRSSDG